MRWTIYLLVSLFLVGCADNYKQYAAAWKSLQLEKHIQSLKAEKDRIALQKEFEVKYETRKLERERAYKDAALAAAKTKTPVDDILVSTMYMMSSQQDMALLLTQHQSPVPVSVESKDAVLVPPETTGQLVQRAGGTILGIGGIVLGITQSHNNKDMMVEALRHVGPTLNVTGDSARVAYDSYKTASQNTVTGNDNSISGGDLSGGMQSDCPECDAEEVQVGPDPENGCNSPAPAICGSNAVCVNGEWKWSYDCSCPSHQAGKC